MEQNYYLRIILWENFIYLIYARVKDLITLLYSCLNITSLFLYRKSLARWMGGIGREGMVLKKITETALEHAPEADIERFLFLMDKLYIVAWLVQKLSSDTYSSLHGGG